MEEKGYETVPEITDGVDDYFAFYNHERFHQSLANATTDAPATDSTKALRPIRCSQ